MGDLRQMYMLVIVSPFESQMDKEFWKFHRAHPEVEAELVILARQGVKQGRTRLGMKALWEILRWNFLMKWDPEEEPLAVKSSGCTDRHHAQDREHHKGEQRRYPPGDRSRYPPDNGPDEGGKGNTAIVWKSLQR